jgi:ribose transport system ATP-binding protein
MPAQTPVVRCEGVSKSFSGREVLHGVTLDIWPGSVHALVGQNGSGKSTLIKILAGFYAPEQGSRLFVKGRSVGLPLSPDMPRRLGMSFVHQDLGLADSLTVLENLLVGRYRRGRGWRIRWREERQRVHGLLELLEMTVRPDSLVSSLTPLDRARVAILRALDELRDHDSALLVLDEPTAYFPRDAVDALFAAVHTIASSGTSVLFVSHRLDEVRRIADWISVIRDGHIVASAPSRAMSEHELIGESLGFSLDELYPPAHVPADEVALSVENLSTERVGPVSFRVHAGEVVGVTGLLGMGWESLLPALYGAESSVSGHVELGGVRHGLAAMRPRNARKSGLMYLPADRQREGGVGGATVVENLTLPVVGSFYRGGRLRHREERERGSETLTAFDVRPPEPNRKFATLSGGNQQKVLLAKWFMTKPRVFLLNEPTQGVDVGARKRIFAEIADAASRGVAFVLASAEYEDLAHLCDRVFVFSHGRVSAELHGDGLTPERLLDMCFRASSSSSFQLDKDVPDALRLP